MKQMRRVFEHNLGIIIPPCKTEFDAEKVFFGQTDKVFN